MTNLKRFKAKLRLRDKSTGTLMVYPCTCGGYHIGNQVPDGTVKLRSARKGRKNQKWRWNCERPEQDEPEEEDDRGGG